MMKKYLILSLLLEIMIFLGGCGDIFKEKKMIDYIENENKLTKEYAIDVLGVDEELLEGVDFEAFVNYYNIGENTTKERIEFDVEYFKEKDYLLTDYSKIFYDIEMVNLTQEMLQNVSIVFLHQSKDTSHDIIVYDFVISKIIMGGHENIILEDDIVGEANEQTRQNVIKLLERYEVYEWVECENLERDNKMEYIVDGSTFWDFKIKFNDGTMYQLRGDSLTDDSAPEDFEKFVEELKALAQNQEVE